ncbi:MAG: DUF4105 domain-containing protein [Myxococcaceae bacterium]|nr:DUF4105 domain-containing protein [Myxococcaceae bacterium]
MLVHSLAVALLLAQAPLPPWAEGGTSQGEDLRISLATFSPGDDLFSWWGHGALIVEDLKANHGRLYNYGMFGFGPDSAWQFVQGRLWFWVGEDSIGGTFSAYKSLNRDVRVQELNLLPEQRLMIARALAKVVLPENRNYLYHHYNDNCSTRPRDLIDQAFGGQLSKATADKPARMSLRLHARRYSAVNPFMAWLLDYVQNDELDRPITVRDEAYLPDELEKQLAALTVTRPDGSTVPAVAKSWTYFKSTRPPPLDVPPNPMGWLLLIGGAIGFLALALAHFWHRGAKWARVLLGLEVALYGLFFGVLGWFLYLTGLFTDHSVAHRNENWFLANPVGLALLPFGLMLAWGSVKAKARIFWVLGLLAATTVLGVVVKVLPPFNQDNWTAIAVMFPATLGLFGAFFIERLSSKRSMK